MSARVATPHSFSILWSFKKQLEEEEKKGLTAEVGSNGQGVPTSGHFDSTLDHHHFGMRTLRPDIQLGNFQFIFLAT